MSTADQLRILAGWRPEDAYLLRKAADELEELKADAERYRAMRREALITKKRGRWRVTWYEPEAQPTDTGIPFRDNVDSAVDRLRKYHANIDAASTLNTQDPHPPSRHCMCPDCAPSFEEEVK